LTRTINTAIYLYSGDDAKGDLSWDAAREVPPSTGEESETPRWVETGVRLMKLAAYLIAFLVVLASSVVAMGTFLFMTSQLKFPRSVSYCNKNYGELIYECFIRPF
jgi:chitin synthase